MTRSEWCKAGKIKAKPLNDSEFDRLTYVLANESPLIKALFADAMFWREALAKQKPIRHPAQGSDDYECPGCHDYCRKTGCTKRDCPWVLAQ